MKPLLGHETLRTSLKSLITQGKLPHAILLSGSSGIGKYLVALEATQTLVCESETKPCHNCKACIQCEHKNFPDLHIIPCKDKDASDVSSIRALINRLSLKSFYNNARIVILRDADYLSLASCNILLKTLEEPLPQTHFFLTASQPSRLPKTILSRVHNWNLHPLNNGEALQIIAAELNLPESDPHVVRLAALCGGCMDILNEHEEFLATEKTLREIFTSLLRQEILPLASFIQEELKSKEAFPLALRVARAIASECTLTPSPHQEIFAEILLNLIDAETLIAERNLNPQVIFYASLSLPFFSEVGSPKTLEDALRLAS